MFLIVVLAAACTFGIPGLVLGLRMGRPGEIMLGALMILVIACPLGLLYAVAAGFAAVAHRPTVTVRNGELTAGLGNVWSATHRLDECLWYEGNLSETNAKPKMVLLGGPVVVVVLPRGTDKQIRLVPTGFSDQTRAIWQAFFRLAGVPKAAPVGRPAGKLLSLVRLAASLLAFPVALVVPFFIADGLGRLLLMAGVNQNLRGTVGVLVWILGAVTTVIYAAFSLDSGRRIRVPAGYSAGKQARIRHEVRTIMLLLAGFLWLMFLRACNWDVPSMLLSALVLPAWGWWMGGYIDRKRAAHDRRIMPNAETAEAVDDEAVEE